MYIKQNELQLKCLHSFMIKKKIKTNKSITKHMERFFVTCSHNYVALKAYLETLPTSLASCTKLI